MHNIKHLLKYVLYITMKNKGMKNIMRVLLRLHRKQFACLGNVFSGFSVYI